MRYNCCRLVFILNSICWYFFLFTVNCEFDRTRMWETSQQIAGRMMVIEKSGPGILKLAADVNEWYRTCLAWACIPVTQAKIRENFSRLILLTCNQNYSSIWCKRVGILGYNVSSKQMWVAWGHIVSK